MQVKKLEQTGKKRTRKLYGEVFPKDGARMRDFYYVSRMWESTIYIIEGEQEVEGMFCLNPCRVWFRGEELTFSYVVAVTMGQKCRRRSITRRTLTEAFRGEYTAGKPFVFLELASPTYYTPFQLVYALRQEKRVLKSDACYHCYAMDVGNESLLSKLSACCNAIFVEKYDIFCLRSPDYLHRVCGEMSVGEGRVLSVRERQVSGDEKLIGMEIFDYPDTREQDTRVVLPDVATLKCCGVKPFIMARILSPPAFSAGISLRKEAAAEEWKFFFSLKDPLTAENNGVFLLRVTERRSFVERLSAKTGRRQYATTLMLEELITVLFGMQRAPWTEELTLYKAYFGEGVQEADCRSGRGERQTEQTEYQEQLRELIQWVSKSQCTVFSGDAGTSTESGIPDFRSTGGLYTEKRRCPSEQVVSHSFFPTYTEQLYDFYRERIFYPNAEPNAAHLALVALERQGKLSAVITQNIDGLHEKAGGKWVLPLHRTVLENHCLRYGKFYSPAELLSCPSTVPHYDCGGIIKSDVMLYKGALNSALLTEAACRIAETDLLIIGETLLAIYPVTGLLHYLGGRHLVVINRNTISADRDVDLVMQTSIGEVLSGTLEEAY